MIGRKAWLFADTPAGAHASAGLYSLIETAPCRMERVHAERLTMPNRAFHEAIFQGFASV